MAARPSTLRLLSLLLGLFLCTGTWANDRLSRLIGRADALYERAAFRSALDHYLDAVEEGARNEHVSRRVGQCYLLLGDPISAEPWLAALVKYLERTPEDLLTYAEVLKALERYEEHEALMCELQCAADAPGWARTQAALEQVRTLRSRSSHFVVNPLAINTPEDEFSPAWHGNGQVIFSSNRSRLSTVPVRDGWTGEAFSCLYIADRQPNGTLGEARTLTGVFDNWSHQGPAAVSGTDGTLYYSTNRRAKGDAQELLEIHRAVYKGGINWQAAGSVKLEGWTAAAFHPTLSADGHTMVFASDAADGAGGVDLYRTRWDVDHWTVPEALAPPVNTTGDELFPFLDADGVLYFASNGHVGLGGFDLFRAEPDGQGGFHAPLNMGTPINSGRDDLGLIVDRSGKNGYFTSNRSGGQGGDDLYSFRLEGELAPAPYLVLGAVRLPEERPYRSGATVHLMDRAGHVLDSMTTDTKGAFRFEVEPRADLLLFAAVPGHTCSPIHVGPIPANERAVLRDVPVVPEDELWLVGSVQRLDTQAPVDQARVSLTNTSSFHTTEVITGATGHFRFRLAANEGYSLVVSGPGCYSNGMELNTAGLGQGTVDRSGAAGLLLAPLDLDRAQPLCAEDEQPAEGIPACVARLADRLTWNPELSVELLSAAHGAVDDGRLRRAYAHLRDLGISSDRVRIVPSTEPCVADGPCYRVVGPEDRSGTQR